MSWGDSRHLVRELSSNALDKAAQHFVEFRRLLSVGKMTRAIEDVHPRVRRAAADEVEDRVALVDGRRGIVVSIIAFSSAGYAIAIDPLTLAALFLHRHINPINARIG